MGRTMWCPACSANLDVSRLAAGQSVRCGQCKSVVVVPADAPEVAPIEPVAPVVSAAPHAFSPRPPLRARRRRVQVANLLPWSIAATLLCCQIGGIFAIVASVHAKSAADRGDVNAARRAEKNARMWLWISAATPFVLGLLWALLEQS